MQYTQEAGSLTMPETVPATVTIHFTDGTTQCFEFEAPEIDPLTSASRLENFLVRKQLQIHASDRVLVIPMQSIKCLEFTPIPDLPPQLQEFVIRNARPVSASQIESWNNITTHRAHDNPTRTDDPVTPVRRTG